MTNRFFWLSAAGVLLSFVGGFLLANSLNRTELNSLRAENERLKSAPANNQQSSDELTLTEDEINQKIAEADKNPGNFQFQKSLGLALYRYGSMKKDAAILDKAARLLERAAQLDPKDYDTTVGVGNAHFDSAYFGTDKSGFKTARLSYEEALKQRPSDVDVRTDLGLTYFLQEPPDDATAIAEFERSLRIDPKHEKTLQFMIQVLVRQGKADEARQYLARLADVNPKNEALGDFKEQLGLESEERK